MAGRGRSQAEPQEPSSREAGLPAKLKAALPADTQEAWRLLAPILPEELYLGGGTGIAVHLKHRESRDLDFFYHRSSVDLKSLAEQIAAAGPFAVTLEGEGTLRGLLGKTKLEFLHADQTTPQRRLEAPAVVAGIAVAGLKDLLAMKLKVVRDRAEMRDYFDVKVIDERSPYSVEEGVAFWLERYGIAPESEHLQVLLTSLGYLDDVEEDAALPISKDELAEWWRRRQAEVLRNLRRS